MNDDGPARTLKEYASVLWPILAALVGAGWTWSQDRQQDARLAEDRQRTAEAQCFAQTQPVVDARLALRRQSSGTAAELDAAREVLILATARARAACNAARMDIPIPVTASLEAAAIAVQAPDLSSAALAAAVPAGAVTAAARPATTGDAGAPGGAGTTATERPGTATAPAAARLRLYIQIGAESQRAEAQQLIDRLRGERFEGVPVITPGVERVARPPAQAELRCLKAVDCRQADAFARWLEPQMKGNRRITVRSLASLYEDRADVRAGTFELWYPAEN